MLLAGPGAGTGASARVQAPVRAQVPGTAPRPAAASDSTTQRAPARPSAPTRRARIRRVRRVPLRPSPIESRPIRRIQIVTLDVFEPDSSSGLAAMHRLANHLHVRTRKGTVRQQLLFGEGQPWSDRLAHETARNLRALDFLVPRRIEARPESDSVDVLVVTRDVWTTSPEINVETSGGSHTGSLGFTERNLLGMGKSISIGYSQNATSTSRHVAYEDLALDGTHVRLRVGAGRSSEGAADQFEIGQPFYAEETPVSYGGSWSRATSVMHLFSRASEVANFDLRDEEASLWYGRKLESNGQITRLTGSFEVIDHRFGPTRMLATGAPTEFAGGEENDRARQLALELRLWRPRYVELVDIDRMDRIEDFDLGSSVRVKAGFAPRFLGSTRNEASLGLRFDGGGENALGFGLLRLQTRTWLRPSPHDLISELDGRWYVLMGAHTLVAGIYGIEGANTSRGFQAVVGGLNGLRAYPVQAVAGSRLWRFNAEERWIFTPEDWSLVKLGSAVFYDTARAWESGAGDSDWFQDAGVGLRVGLPTIGLSQVLRLDVAWPLQPSRDGRREAVFSFGSAQAF